MEPFAVQFDDIMRDAYLKIVDIENVNDAQRLQLSLPLRHGGCGLRSHTASELQRLFVSSALLVAPAVHAATGLHVRPADPAAQDDAEIFCPFEFQLHTSLETLEEQGIARQLSALSASVRQMRLCGLMVWQKNFLSSLAKIWIRCSKICPQENAIITKLG